MGRISRLPRERGNGVRGPRSQVKKRPMSWHDPQQDELFLRKGRNSRGIKREIKWNLNSALTRFDGGESSMRDVVVKIVGVRWHHMLVELRHRSVKTESQHQYQRKHKHDTRSASVIEAGAKVHIGCQPGSKVKKFQ